MQITNSAVHAKWAVVFAQLHMGGKNEGIHGFLVRIRNEVRLIWTQLFLTSARDEEQTALCYAAM